MLRASLSAAVFSGVVMIRWLLVARLSAHVFRDKHISANRRRVQLLQFRRPLRLTTEQAHEMGRFIFKLTYRDSTIMRNYLVGVPIGPRFSTSASTDCRSASRNGSSGSVEHCISTGARRAATGALRFQWLPSCCTARFTVPLPQ